MDGLGPHGESDQGFIILETNYHVYAYTGMLFAVTYVLFRRLTISTDNPLQTAVLNLFVTFKTRFSNLIVGTITRESVKKALANGISAKQVRTPPCHVT